MPSPTRPTLSRFLLPLLALVLMLPAAAQEGRDFPLGPIGGSFRVTANSSAALVSAVTAGEPGALAGLRVGDFIYGAFGQTFTPTGSYHYGVSQDLGFAVDRAEGADGVLPLCVLRPGAGSITLSVNLPAAGAFGPAYPLNSAKFAAMYETAVADLHTRAMNGNGNVGYLTGFTGLCLLGHPNWNVTTGDKPYRLSINKIRDFAVSQIANWGYAPTESKLLDGSAIPNPVGGPSNWELGPLMMFLSEYYMKTSDSSVAFSLQRGVEMCGNTVQWWKQPADNPDGFSPEYAQVAGMSSHGGVTGDYMGQGWYCGINVCGVHNFNGMAFARRAGMEMSVRPKDGHYFGFTLNPGDPIPASIINALPTSITLPQYAADPVRGLTIANTSSPLNRSDASDPFWYDPSVNQKFLMQMNFMARRSIGGDGCIGYAPEAITNYDAAARTPGTLLGMTLYNQDVGGLDSADLNRLELLKTYITTNYMRHQEAHVYCIGGQVFQALCAPYLSDRQQRFFMDNWRFYFALSRTSTNAIRYFQDRSMADSGAYLDDNHCASINMALPYGVAQGNYKMISGYNTNRSLANFKSPILTWPQFDARAVTVYSGSQAFQIDVCDGTGNVLAPGSYTAAWSNVSGPAATFSSNSTANTTITLPGVSATPYRVRLTVTRANVPTLTEDIDITRANAVVPVSNAITTQPANQTTVPGGSVVFTVGTSGDGPFVYQWRLNGVAYWGTTTSPTLSLANVGSGSLGSYDCVVTTPTGPLVSTAATLTFNSPPARTPGGLRREIWTGLGGSAITDLTGNSNYPLFPSVTTAVSSAEGPSGYGDNYGQKLSGWLKPPVTGDYKFYLTSDDSSQLWLSTDDSVANKSLIAELTSWVGYRAYSVGAKSAPIHLLGGGKYYIEILHKESSGNDWVSAAWQMPGDPVPADGSAPIDGNYLEYDQYLPLLTNEWKFDEASGSVCADSIGGATATLYNNPARVAGISGNAISFNGVNQYAMAAVDVSETVYAVSLWFRTSQPGGGMFSVTDAGGGSHDRHIYLNGGNICSRIWSEETITSTGQNYGDGQWHHVVHTFGGAIGGQKLYVDGVEVASGGKSQSDFTWQTNIRIGYSASSPVNYFNGLIDDVRVYNAGLAASDAAAIYQNGLNAPPQLGAFAFTVPENLAVGAAVGTVAATDASAGQTLSYAIVGGNVGNKFAINPATGAITVAAALDYETTAICVLTITATDNGNPAQSATNTATINITDVNEPPVFPSNPLTGKPAAPGLAYSGTITATDPEAAGPVTFAKISGPAWLSVAADGTLTGTPVTANAGTNNFTVRATDSTSLSADVTLRIEVVNVATNPVWINPAGGSWTVSGNWLAGGIANGQAATADLSTLDLTADAVVTLDGARTVGGLIFGDSAASNNWTLATGTGGPLTLGVPSGTPVVTVTNQTATINAALAGSQGLVKTGTGTLTLGAANTLTGAVTVRQGILIVTNQSALGSTTGVALGDSGTGANPAGFKVDNGVTGTLNLTAITTSAFGTGQSITLNSGGALGQNVSALNCTLNLTGSVPLTLTATNTGGHATAQDWSGRIIGTGIASNTTALTLDGTSASLRLSFGNSANPNTFTGDVTVKGTVTTQNQTYSGNTAANQNNGFRTNNITVAAGGTWLIVWGGETIGALNGAGNVSLNCQSALNNIGLTLGNTNIDGYFSGGIGGSFGLMKTGGGTQTLAGSNTYGGATTVNAGVLRINGTLGGSGVTVSPGATLGGRGTITSQVTLSAGATLAAGDTTTGTLTFSNNIALNDSGTVALRISKTAGVVSADRINVTAAAGIAYKGTLTVATMAGSDALAAGDVITLFQAPAGAITGGFATVTLPTLPATLRWDTTRLTVDGAIEVKTLPPAATPAFSLAAGIYVGAQSVSISSATTGASIRYTTDGSDPVSSATAITAGSPVSITVSAPSSVTLKAYAFATGYTNSVTASASYEALATNAPVWTNTAGGSWPVGPNWLGGAAPAGSDVIARFDTLDLTTDAAVTLDGARTIGGLKFNDTSASNNWTLGAGTGGALTLAVTSGSPLIHVANPTATIGAVLAGTQGFVKTGTGNLVLSATDTLTGNIVISQGTLTLNSNTALPTTANITIGDSNSGTTAPNLYLGNQLAPTIATLTVAANVAGAKIYTSGWAPTVSGITTLNSPLTIQQYNGGYVHTGIQTNGKITGPGAGAGNDTLILNYGGSQNFYWQANNTAANDFIGNVRVTGAAGHMNAQGGTNAANNIMIPDAAMITIDSGCSFCWNNFGNNAVVETFDGLAGSGSMIRNTSGGLITSITLTINASNPANNGKRVFTGSLSGVDSLTITGTGTQEFAGANTYTGPTAINGGTLIVNGSQANTATTVAATGTLGGVGTLAGTVTNNGTLAPGSSGPGTLTINSSLTLAPGSKLIWEINDWTGTAGIASDKIAATTLNLTATSANRITIRPLDLALAHFSEAGATFILVQTTGGITGFSADKFTIDTSGLILPRGTWAVQQSGNNLLLAYTRFNTIPAFAANPFSRNAATQDTYYSATLAGTVIDPDPGEVLTFSKDSGPTWLNVAPNGDLTGTPANADTGVNSFSVRVTDSMGATAAATLEITVINVNDPPVFPSTPITGAAGTQGVAYSATLAGTATDPDTGDTLRFSKVSGPAWLSIATNGALTGTPSGANTGANSFVVRVTDAGGLHADATLNIQVAALPDSNGNGILDAWEIAHFGNANQGANAADADPDGDGLSNLMEYALNTDPLVSNASPLVHDLETLAGQSYLRLTVPKNPAATNLTYTVETCGPLTAWSATDTVVEIDNSNQLIVRDKIPTHNAARRFIRLKVTATP